MDALATAREPERRVIGEGCETAGEKGKKGSEAPTNSDAVEPKYTAESGIALLESHGIDCARDWTQTCQGDLDNVFFFQRVLVKGVVLVKGFVHVFGEALGSVVDRVATTPLAFIADLCQSSIGHDGRLMA